jgi:hypothetical protein
VRTPAGGLGDARDYEFPFPLALTKGKNEVTLTVEGVDGVDLSDAWFRVRHAFTTASKYDSWTFPILWANTENDEFARIFVENVSAVVREFGIDAVHIDAGSFEHSRKLFEGVHRRVPEVAMGAEWYTTLEAIDFLVFCQNARQTMLRYWPCDDCEQASLPAKGLQEYREPWLEKTSPVCRFVRDYCLFYPHLCAANAFVPTGKVCNIWPKRQIPYDIEEQWRVLRDAKRLDHIPGIRVNYREYGLDDGTREAVKEIGWPRKR